MSLAPALFTANASKLIIMEVCGVVKMKKSNNFAQTGPGYLNDAVIYKMKKKNRDIPLLNIQGLFTESILQ